MQTEKDNIIQIKRLSSDTNYYNNVFKKTEKIVSVTFYILSETKTSTGAEMHVQSIKDRALKTHELSLETLTLQPHEQHEGLLRFQYGLVALDSTLRIANMAGVIPKDIFILLADQLDTVLRYINNHFLQNEGISVAELTETIVPKSQLASSAKPRPVEREKRQKRVNIPSGDISTDAYLVYSQLTDRGERIKTVLEAKPQATVKDIAEIVTDVSEKTIQRELNSLIEKGQVIREGERRWSKYSVSK
ncbi:MAG: DNA-binding transcriptional ArsR family regulator [Candidatus Paceibacteria bacterium]|jgi:DNA-binding transcriptional ArsR family regulator